MSPRGDRSTRSIYSLDSDVTFVLTTGGHNAGIVSEPGHRNRSYQITHHKPGDRHPDAETWQSTAPRKEGSWWPAWQAWLVQHSTGQAAPPSLGAPETGIFWDRRRAWHLRIARIRVETLVRRQDEFKISSPQSPMFRFGGGRP